MSHSSFAVNLLAGAHAALLGSPGLSHMEVRGAVVMGLTYGLVRVIGPDHLATLMTLASAASPASAFRVGASWGLGHSLGVVMMAGVFLLLHRLLTLNMEKWEHYGNYFIGASMMACGLYFILNESSFLKANACHSHACHSHLPKDKPEDEAARQGSCWRRVWAARDFKGALLGVFQGFCCPLGLLGVTFLANLHPQGLAAFLVVFMFVSAFGTGSFALAWASLSAWGCGTTISPRTVFRVSCGFTVALGVTWIVCNKIGIIDKLDYTEGLESVGAPSVGEPIFPPEVL